MRQLFSLYLNLSMPIVPKLVDEALIVRVVCEIHQTTAECVKIKASDFKILSENGENFCSDIYVVNVQYVLNGNDNQETSFILKILKQGITKIGTNESLMLTKVLPVMETYLNVMEEREKEKLFATCFLTEHRGHQEFYVLENLNALGYYCADRVKGLNAAQANLVMKKLGKYHAASMLYQKRFPQVVESLRKSQLAKGYLDAVGEAIIFGGFEYVANMTQNWPGYEHLKPRLHELKNRFNDLAKQAVDPANSSFNVINHGDMWVNNILFKYDQESQEPMDALFVDFQETFWASCGYDLSCFLYTSLELPVLKNNRKKLLQTYYHNLKETLLENQYPTDAIPSWRGILLELKRCEIIGIYVTLSEFPMDALDRTTSKSLTSETFKNAEELAKMRIPMYENPRVQEHLLYALKYFEESGLL